MIPTAQNHKFTSEGCTVCTAYDTLYPETLNSDNKKLLKKTNFRNPRATEKRSRTDRHAIVVLWTEDERTT